MSGKKGLIVKGIAGFYYVKSGDEVYRCKARGVFKQRAVKPAVGDEVEFEVIPENDDSLITGVLPRRNSFIRPFIANVDCFAIVTAAASPAPILSVIDKFMVMAEKTVQRSSFVSINVIWQKETGELQRRHRKALPRCKGSTDLCIRYF